MYEFDWSSIAPQPALSAARLDCNCQNNPHRHCVRDPLGNNFGSDASVTD